MKEMMELKVSVDIPRPTTHHGNFTEISILEDQKMGKFSITLTYSVLH